MCNPVKVFEAIVEKANDKPSIDIKLLVSPDADRATLIPEPMPTSLLNLEELKILSNPGNQYTIEAQIKNGKSYSDLVSIASKKSINKDKLKEVLPFINQSARELLLLRNTDKIAEEKQKYKRR